MTDKPRMLHVEDNEGDRVLLALAMEESGAEVLIEAARDGEQAIGMIESWTTPAQWPAVVVIDLNLPKRSGLEVLEAVRQHPVGKDVPAIVLTSSDSRLDRDRACELGVCAFLMKPMEVDGFVVIGQVLRRLLISAGRKANAWHNLSK